MLVPVLAPVSPTPAFADTWADPIPLESIPVSIRDRVHSIVPNAVPAFALHTDWRPLDAGSDTQGRSFFFLDRGSLSDALAALGPDGSPLWEHEITGCDASSPGNLMQLGANGSVLVAYGLWDDGDDYYLLLRPDGAIAIDDTLASDGDGRALTMSLCGRYYYRYRQGVDEIVLQLVAGGELKLPLPKSPSDLQPLDELPTLVRFLSPELLFAATRFTNAPPRRIVWDLTVDPRRMIEPEALQDVPPEQHLSGPLAGDLTPTGDLILFEEWEGEYALRYEACCYDSRGALKWHQSPNLRWPGWIFAAKDHPIIAVASNTWLTTLDVSTGLTLDTKRLWEESSHAWPHPHEGAFDDGLLTLGGRGGGDGNTPILISVQVGEDGEISPPIVTRDWIWGFGKDRPICGAAVPDSAGGWLIAGFRRQ